MYRCAAIAVCAAIALYIAFSIRKYAADRIEFHTAVVDFIAYVKQQITYFCAPTNKIIEGYSSPVFEKNSIFAPDSIDNNIYLDDRGKKIIHDFFARLGRCTAEEQVSNCDYTITQLNMLISEYRDDMNKRYKAYSGMAVIVGLMLIILLL